MHRSDSAAEPRPAMAAAVCVLLVAVPPGAAGSERSHLDQSYGQIPLAFEANNGQTDPQVAFLARGAGYALFLTPREAVLSLRTGGPAQEPAGPSSDRPSALPRSDVLRVRLRGASRSPRLTGLDPQPGRSNYFIGNDPARWRSDVPQFGKVRYEQVYPGIDLVYYGRQRQLEFDFVVQPGADPRRIRLEFQGAERLEVDAAGDLLVHVGPGVLRQHKPVVYQERDGERMRVAGSYVLEGRRRVSVRVGDYDRARVLVIDPVLAYSTYLGGDGLDYYTGFAIDSAGNAYVTGATRSINFPTVAAIQPVHAGGTDDAFVAKLNVAGSALLYSTYLGGSGADFAYAIAVDSSSNAYVAGRTSSTNFPTVAPLQGAHAGGADDAFVAKLDATGSALAYSTYLGGTAEDMAFAITVDNLACAHLTGHTSSTDFPTANPMQGANAGTYDAFVAGLNAAGSALAYSTFLGGAEQERGYGIAVDGSGSAYVTGWTASSDFPTSGPIQAALAGGFDVYVTKFSPAGSMLYSTYLGGSSDDSGNGVAVDGLGSAYVVGYTSSVDFPTASPFQGAKAGNQDAFVAKLSASGAALVYSTYLGGTGMDTGNSIAVDAAGQAHVAGSTSSTNFPTAEPLQGANAGASDAFVAKLGAIGAPLLHSTYLGGSGGDYGDGIAVHGTRGVVVRGVTASADFPTANPLQGGHRGGFYDIFVAKLASVPKGDIDRDGFPDLVFRSNANGAQNKVWLMNGVARASEATITPNAASPDWKVRGVDDFNADGRQDLAFWNQVTGNVEFWLMNGNARVGSPVPLSGGAVLPTNWDLAATADFNADGRPDIVWRNFTSQKLVIWTMNGTAKLGNIVPTPDQAVDANWMVVAALDYDNDGHTDFLWYNYSSGKIVTWYMNASVARTSGQFTTPANAGDANWKVVASADYSGNYVPGTPPSGSPDIVWRNETSGNQVVWHMDFNSTRVHGQFTSPAANTPALDWTIVGPR